jgi:hypothetical protein
VYVREGVSKGLLLAVYADVVISVLPEKKPPIETGGLENNLEEEGIPLSPTQREIIA